MLLAKFDGARQMRILLIDPPFYRFIGYYNRYFPLGRPRTFNQQIIELLQKFRFKLACSIIWGSDNSKTDVLALHRIRIDAQDTFDDFKFKVNGLWDFIAFFQKIR